MFFKKAAKQIFLSIVVLIFSATTLLAQTAPPQTTTPPPAELPDDYPDEQLELFVNAISKVMTIQEQGQLSMVEAIEEQDISVDRFNELLTEAQQKGPESLDASEDEKQAFNETLAQVQSMQMEMEQTMMKAVEDEGLKVEEYQQIMQSYSVNPTVKEKVDKLMSEEQ